MRETKEKEIERLGPTQPTRRPPSGSMPPEFDQPRLIRIQLQVELREPLPKIDKKPPRISFMLETHHDIIGETHDDHITMRIPTSPPVSPQVENIVQVHVSHQRQRRGTLRCPLQCLQPVPILDDSCSQPLTDETQDSLIGDPVLKKLS
jgi:hypothetical protein